MIEISKEIMAQLKKNCIKERFQLTTEFICSPTRDPDSFALTGRDVWCYSFTNCFLVAFKLTRIKCTVVHVRSRVNVLVTFSKRAWLVNNNATIFPVFVLVRHGCGTCFARCALTEGWTAWYESHLPALPKLFCIGGCLTISHGPVILANSIVVATQTT